MNLHTVIKQSINLLQINLLSKDSKLKVTNDLLKFNITENMHVDKPPHFFEEDKYKILEWYAGQLLVMVMYPDNLLDEKVVYQFLDSFKEFEDKYFKIN